MSPDDIISYRINLSEEKGHAGYYQAKVQDDIKAELTVTERTGMARYEYSSNVSFGTIIIGAGVAATNTENATVVITGVNTCEGYAQGGTFCGYPTPYKVYFVAEFDTNAIEVGTWKDDKIREKSVFAEGKNSGVFFTFDMSKNKVIQYKIGVSYVSVENARENLRAENSAWNFDVIKNQAEKME